MTNAERDGRIGVKVPAISGDEEIWALSITQNRRAFVPDQGDEVVVAFEQGDPRRPIVLGRLWGSPCPPPP